MPTLVIDGFGRRVNSLETAVSAAGALIDASRLGPRVADPSPFRPREPRPGLAGPVPGAGAGGRGLGAGARAETSCGRSATGLPRGRRRPEHLLHSRLRTVRRGALGDGRGRRQPAPVRVHLPESGRAHAGRAHAGHAPGDADLPRRLARGRRRPAPGAVQPGRRRRRGGRALAGQPDRRRDAWARAGIRAAPLAPLRAGARGKRQVPPDDLALPRASRRDRPRPRVLARGGDLLPRDRAAVAARLPGEGLLAADRALLGAGARGNGGTGRRAHRSSRTQRSSTSCSRSTPS